MKRPGMRPAAVLSEAARNVLSGTTSALLLAVALGTICAGLAVTDARSIIDLRRAATEYVSSGASVRTLVAEKQVDGQACDALASAGDVRTSGALKTGDSVTLLAAPRNAVPGYQVTPGLAAVIGVQASTTTGVWISDELAKTLQVARGQSLASAHGELTIAGTFSWPDDGRDSRFSYAVLSPVSESNSQMDECWAEVWPSTEAADGLIRSATFVKTTSTESITVSQLNKAYGASFDARTQFLIRPTRFALLGCLATGLVLGLVSVRRRRLEYAGALHAGQRRVAQMATAMVELAIWSVAGATLASCVLCLALWVMNDSALAETFMIDVKGPAMALLGSAAGVLAGLCLIREEHLFQYFKDR